MKTFVLAAAFLFPTTLAAQALDPSFAASSPPSLDRAWHRAGPTVPTAFEHEGESRRSHPRRHRWGERVFRRLGPDYKLRTFFDSTVNPRMRIGRPDPWTDFKMLVPAEPWELRPRARRDRPHRRFRTR